MPTPYYDLLLKTLQAEGEISQLQYDIQNSPPAMKEITTKLFNVVTLNLYHTVALTEELVRLNVLRRAEQVPVPAPQAAPQQSRAVQQTLSPFPSPPTISLPRLATPSTGAGISPTEITPCDVPQVVITAGGTRVIPPVGTGATPVVLPPNTPVNLEHMQVAPAPTPVANGADVVLPRGGALPAEVQSALNARQGAPSR
jgi:hypothetical protein